MSASLGLRDVIGPIMVGPSSSHTAGALRIAAMARNLVSARLVRAECTLYGSFARTGRGHGTDRALAAGLLGLHTDDLRIRDSLALAEEAGLDVTFRFDRVTRTSHPNTVDLRLQDDSGDVVTVRGESIGGGAALLTQIDGLDVHITGALNSVVVYERDVPGVLGIIASTFGEAGVNIGSVVMRRRRRGGEAFNVLEVDSAIPEGVTERLLENPNIERIRFIPADGSGRRGRAKGTCADGGAKPAAGVPSVGPEEAERLFDAIDFVDAASLLRYAEEENESLGQAFLDRERLRLAIDGMGEGAIDDYLRHAYDVMRESVRTSLEGESHTMGDLIGGEAREMRRLHLDALDGAYAKAATYALAVLETNASMGRIVAAPTAGSSGVLPGVLLALQEELGLSDGRIREALATAAAVGYVVTRNGTVAGAEGGCQAEMGTASAMAAAAAADLLGGGPRTCLSAAAIALTNMLGLVCDPVCGLVEEPCQKRNASAATNALVSARMALAGIAPTAPFDETVDAMLRVGRAMPAELRETGLGGIAACPSCRRT